MDTGKEKKEGGGNISKYLICGLVGGFVLLFAGLSIPLGALVAAGFFIMVVSFIALNFALYRNYSSTEYYKDYVNRYDWHNIW